MGGDCRQYGSRKGGCEAPLCQFGMWPMVGLVGLVALVAARAGPWWAWWPPGLASPD